MKKGDLHKKLPKLTIQLNPLKHLIEQSYSTKARPEVKAILLLNPPSLQSPLGITARKTQWLLKNQTPKSKTKKSIESTETLPTGVTTKRSKRYLQNIIRYNLLLEHKRNYEEAQIEEIDKIVYNDRAHVVAIFKDFLIYDDVKELLQRYHKAIESMYLIYKIAKGVTKKFTPSTLILSENAILKKAETKKHKIRRIKEADKLIQENESTFFRTAFMNSLAKEDMSNSLSRFPANSLECSHDEDTNKIVELLKELNNKDASVVVKKEEEKRNKNTKAKKEEKKQVSLNKKIACIVKEQQKFRPTTTLQRNVKLASPNSCYFVTPRTIKVGPSEITKVGTSTKRDSSLGTASIESLSKATVNRFSKISKGSNKDSTLIRLLSDSKLSSRKSDTHLATEPIITTVKIAKPQQKSDSRKSNYFAIYKGEKGSKPKPYTKPSNSSREAYQTSPVPPNPLTKKPPPQSKQILASKPSLKNVLQQSTGNLLSKSAQIAKLAKVGTKVTRIQQVQANLLRSTPDVIGKSNKYFSPRFKLP